MNKVLLIDDDDQLRAALAEGLREAGFEVLTASDGAQGLRLQREHRANAVVTDLFMPGQEGMETLHRLRSAYPTLKIIAISGGIAQGGKSDFLPVAGTIGADHCLRKPFRTAELVAALRQLLATPTSGAGSSLK
jgi:DNA-binding response OmpR family regulator